MNINIITHTSFDVTEEVKEACDNKNECLFEGSNGIAGDPCVGVPKYTRVQFSCYGKLINKIEIINYF